MGRLAQPSIAPLGAPATSEEEQPEPEEQAGVTLRRVALPADATAATRVARRVRRGAPRAAVATARTGVRRRLAR